MEKKAIISFGYNYFVADVELAIKALDVFENLVLVNREYVDGRYIFQPAKAQESVTVEFIPADRVRAITKEEKENKEIKDLKNSIAFRDTQIREKDEKLEALQCQLKLLQSEAPITKEED